MLLLIETGVRRGEACGLQWKYVDFKKASITIAGNLCYTPTAGVYLNTPKSGKTRTMSVSPEILDLFRVLRKEQLYTGVSDFVFTQEDLNGPTREPMHPQSPTHYMTQFAKKYNVKNLHPHKLRHSFASIAITNGADIASVSELLGHADKSTTLRIYAHADEESMRKASSIFRDAIGMQKRA